MKNFAKITALGALLLLVSGCASYATSQNQTKPSAQPAAPSSSPSQTGAAATQAKSNAIMIQNFAFSPSVLRVKKGTTVTWTNKDSAPHQISSPTFNSASLSTGQSFSFVFNEAGTFDYICSIHPSMKGQVIVE
jgi:plastocyanin